MRVLNYFLSISALIFLTSTVYANVNIVNEVVKANIESEQESFKIVKVVEGLEHPWAVNWLSEDMMIITERPGSMYLVTNDNVHKLGNLPVIDTDEDQLTAPQGGNQGGLLDVVPHPNYQENGWIYYTLSSPGDADAVVSDDDYGTGTALVRSRIDFDNYELKDTEFLYVQMPRTNPGRHYGSRIVFPGDGTVIFSIGDRGLRSPSQDLTNPIGSFIRLMDDGSIPEDNPFIGMPPGNIRPEIFSFGHRNNQGIAICPETNEIWSTEHGPYGGDLLHKVSMGNNYGWPYVAYGVEYSTKQPIGVSQNNPGVQSPYYIWEESMAPSGLTFYTGDVFENWNGNLFAGSLLREEIKRIVIQNDEVVHVEVLFSELVGRVRDVRQGPDGFIYFITDQSDGGVYRIESN
ncbi:MAG: PQQ-dependent sugar dehydrogenase [Chitinophagaceae bacterium]|nr:MAG: PQQ-dependent sugar dehydrogenase [Chitinophagaceae bacterium]